MDYCASVMGDDQILGKCLVQVNFLGASLLYFEPDVVHICVNGCTACFKDLFVRYLLT